MGMKKQKENQKLLSEGCIICRSTICREELPNYWCEMVSGGNRIIHSKSQKLIIGVDE